MEALRVVVESCEVVGINLRTLPVPPNHLPTINRC